MVPRPQQEEEERRGSRGRRRDSRSRSRSRSRDRGRREKDDHEQWVKPPSSQREEGLSYLKVLLLNLTNFNIF